MQLVDAISIPSSPANQSEFAQSIKKKPFPHACMYAWMDGWMDVPRDTLSQPSPAAQPAGEDGYGDRHGMGYEMDMGLGLRALAPIPLGG